MRKYLRNAALGAAALALLAGGMTPAGTAIADEKIKVYVSLGFEGNTWMDAATNLLSSIAGTKDYKDRVDIQIQSARGNAQTQIQQINAMVQAGAQVIVSWALSPTALNRAIRNACRRGVVFVTFDAQVTEPCAYHVGDLEDNSAGFRPVCYERCNRKTIAVDPWLLAITPPTGSNVS